MLTNDVLAALWTRKLGGEKVSELAAEVGLSKQGLVGAWKKAGFKAAKETTEMSDEQTVDAVEPAAVAEPAVEQAVAEPTNEGDVAGEEAAQDEGGEVDEPERETEDIEVQEIPLAAMTLLPPAGNVCQVCATGHQADQPHNAQSLYYQMAFRQQHDRWPTWKDAMSHCSPEVRGFWEKALAERGVSLDSAGG
jgi:rhodanese-related sulfurtransferase